MLAAASACGSQCRRFPDGLAVRLRLPLRCAARPREKIQVQLLLADLSLKLLDPPPRRRSSSAGSRRTAGRDQRRAAALARQIKRRCTPGLIGASPFQQHLTPDAEFHRQTMQRRRRLDPSNRRKLELLTPPYSSLRHICSHYRTVSLGSECIIPSALDIDRCPFAGADGSDANWIIDQPVPGRFAGLDNFVIAVPDG
jgi:hypothetical protein